jgi:subtilisin family serine protease
MLAGALLVAALHDPADREATPPRPAGTSGSVPQLPTLLVRPRYTPGPTSRVPGPRAGVGAGARAQPTYVSGQLLVKFEPGTSTTVANAVLERADAEPESRVREIDVRVVDVPATETATAIAALKASPAVEFVERDVAVEMLQTTPNDSLWSSQWGPLVIGAPKGWQKTTGAPDVVVAVLDTGIESGHPDLSGSLVPGFDFTNGDADADDDNGHGTAAAAVVAARTNNARGHAGICWRCSLMPVKVLGADGFGSTAALASGIVWAVDRGADVISMSLGGPGTTQTLTNAIEYAAGKGVVLVAAAGNSGSATPSYPAAYPQVLSVAGTTEAGTLYSWSNFGSWVQVAAPGCNTAAYLGARYVTFCGTSSATPVVAGLAGLLRSAKPGLGKAAVEQAIQSTAVRFSTAVQFGRIDVHAALQSVTESPPPPSPPPVPPPASPPGVAPPPASPAPGPDGSPNEVVQTIRGQIAPGANPPRYTRTLQAGTMTATLRFRGSTRLTLTIVDRGRRRTVARVSGRSPLQLSRRVAAGRHTFVVSGRRASFALRIASPAPLSS